MATYISILRGINVSGHKMIRMEALRQMFESIDCKNVQTYIQSGNVVFQYKKTETQKLENIIAKKISSQFSFEVPVIVKELEELKTIIEKNPFKNNPSKDAAHLHVTFLSALPEKNAIEKTKEGQYAADDFLISDKAVYLYCPNGYGNSKLTNTFFENKLKVMATTRNWKTTNELLSMSEKLESKQTTRK
jgi:uncharacterized protein (DUF1697 family)